MVRKTNENSSVRNVSLQHINGTAAISYDAALSGVQGEAASPRTLPISRNDIILSVAEVDEEGNLIVLPLEETEEEDQQKDECEVISGEESSFFGDNDHGDVYIPMGTEYVRNTPVSVKEKKTLPQAEGIVYEVAEELYRKEKTAERLEALCQPPFKKIFNPQQLQRLNDEANQKLSTMLAETDADKKASDSEARDIKQRPISTVTAFFLQTVMLFPILNVFVMMILTFRKDTNINLKAYSKAFLLHSFIVMTIALLFLTVNFFTNSGHSSFIQKIFNLFSE